MNEPAATHLVVWRLHVDSILIWGAAATAVLTTIMFLGQGLKLSRISLPFMLGTVFTPNRDRAYIYGFIAHFIYGWIWSLFYALVFASLDLATWWIGLIIGFVQGLYSLSVLVILLPYLHPRMATEHDGPTISRMLEPPGFMALNYGRRTPLITMIAHLAFGVIIGAFYGVV